ncbi:MAG: mechanosensitive ion channel [Deltaproteobacteria bacterium]|nr:mechanosensitive ion channel [Deltaproteobacteria bacterium]
MTNLVDTLKVAIAPLLPGLLLSAFLILALVVLRVVLRGDALRSKLKLPSTLIALYGVTVGLVVAAQLYWTQVTVVLTVMSLFILILALILALAFGIFDLFLGRYRGRIIPRIFRDFLVVVVYIVAIVVILGRFGVDLTGILTTSAVLTAVIGLALQDLLSNFISGLALQIERPFTAGDWVKFGDQEGTILEVNWRATKIETLHSDIVVVPNNVITKSALINMSAPTPVHRQHLTIGLRYEAPPNRVKASILKAAREVEGVLSDPEPFVLLRSYADFSIVYRLNFFINTLPRHERIEDQVFTRLWYQLKRDGLSIPFPISDVNLRHVVPDEDRARQEQDLDRIVDALGQVPFLVPLSSEEKRTLAGRLRHVHFAVGERIIREGDKGDSFYIIAEGEVSVRVGRQGREVAALHGGDYFGEMSLMTGEARSATVVARMDTECYVVDKHAFEALIQADEALIEAIGACLTTRRQSLAASQEAMDRDHARDDAAGADSGLVLRIRRFFGM